MGFEGGEAQTQTKTYLQDRLKTREFQKQLLPLERFATREGRGWDGSELMVCWCELEDPFLSVSVTGDKAVTQCGKHFPPYLFYGSSPVGKISVAQCCMVNLRKIKISLGREGADCISAGMLERMIKDGMEKQITK